MRLKYLIFSLFHMLTLSVSAQSEVEAHDFEQISKDILSKRSEFYYPALMRRYLDNDSTLNLVDYRYLYYGFALQEDYNPYRISPFQAKLKEFSEIENKDKSVCDSIVKYARKSIDDFPFDTRSMNMLIYAYQCLGDKDQSTLWTIKLKSILDTIISSGDGDSMDSPYYVIYAPHEYEIVYRYGLVPTQISMPDSVTDFIEVEKNNFDIEGYFFNIKKPLEAYGLKFE